MMHIYRQHIMSIYFVFILSTHSIVHYDFGNVVHSGGGLANARVFAATVAAGATINHPSTIAGGCVAARTNDRRDKVEVELDRRPETTSAWRLHCSDDRRSAV